MPIEVTESATVITGKGINTYRLVALKHAVNMQSKGMKIRQLPNPRKTACLELGLPLRTPYADVIEALQAKADASNAADKAEGKEG